MRASAQFRPAGILLCLLSAAGPASANSADGAREISLAESLELALEPPVFNTNPGPEYSDKARDYGMVIGMDRTPKGRIWAAWVAGGDSEDGYFVAATSDDDGRTWSKPRLVIDPAEAANGLKRRTLAGGALDRPAGPALVVLRPVHGLF